MSRCFFGVDGVGRRKRPVLDESNDDKHKRVKYLKSPYLSEDGQTLRKIRRVVLSEEKRLIDEGEAGKAPLSLDEPREFEFEGITGVGELAHSKNEKDEVEKK